MVQYPQNIVIPPEVVDFIETFYRISDDPSETDRYVDCFTEDATFILASKRAESHPAIRTMREGMWASVVSRKHRVFKVFPFGPDFQEVMIYGTVALDLKSGDSLEFDWAARAELTASSPDGRYRMKFYQVYLDTGASTAYKK